MLLLASFLVVGAYQMFFPGFFRVSRFTLYPLDPVYFLMIVKIAHYALTHPRSTQALIRENRFLIAFLAMMAVYVVIYTPTYGQSAVGETRKFYFAFLFPLTALITIKSAEDLRRLVLVMVGVAACTALVALARVGMQGTVLRVLNGELTLMLAFLALAVWVHQVHRIAIVTPRADKFLLVLFSGLVLLSAQRSVWLGMGFAVVLTLWLYRHWTVLISKIAALCLAGVLAMTAGLIMFPETGSRLAEKFSGIVNPYGDPNAAWRISNWEQQMEIVKQNPLFGEGVGSYYSWEVGRGYEATRSPHNAYIQLMLKFGLFGLVLYGLLALHFFRRTLRVHKMLGAGPMRAYIEMSLLTFGASHAYNLGYGFHPFALVFYGIGLCAVTLVERSLRQRQAVAIGTEPLRPYPRPAGAGRRLDEPPVFASSGVRQRPARP